MRSSCPKSQLSEEIEGDDAELLAKAYSIGMGGVIAKHRVSPYRPGRTGDWLKIKCVQSKSFMIVGYEQSAVARGGIGSLLLAARRDHDWSMSAPSARASRKRMQPT
ncbi:bifunctional non-homologous end joining protein LigD [Rhizobium sp. NFACC06-2]|nr:bifunctional non-homologous end joining protein LigD [Rhizobium sp. NFACC06-2]